jgi:1-acyl-sn-glycerol-3-phosphate acyltransferase
LRDLKGATLILPNHPGYMDPLLLKTELWTTLRPRPLVAENTFKNPLIYRR